MAKILRNSLHEQSRQIDFAKLIIPINAWVKVRLTTKENEMESFSETVLRNWEFKYNNKNNLDVIIILWKRFIKMVEIKVNFIAGLTLSNARYIKKKLLSLHLTNDFNN